MRERERERERERKCVCTVYGEGGELTDKSYVLIRGQCVCLCLNIEYSLPKYIKYQIYKINYFRNFFGDYISEFKPRSVIFREKKPILR